MLLEAWVQVAAIRKPSADQVSLSLAYTTPPPCPCYLCYPFTPVCYTFPLSMPSRKMNVLLCYLERPSSPSWGEENLVSTVTMSG